jgi:hypothetical protein
MLKLKAVKENKDDSKSEAGQKARIPGWSLPSVVRLVRICSTSWPDTVLLVVLSSIP